MAKDDVIVVDGKVVEALPNAMFRGSHYEHTVAVGDGRAVILSNREN